MRTEPRGSLTRGSAPVPFQGAGVFRSTHPKCELACAFSPLLRSNRVMPTGYPGEPDRTEGTHVSGKPNTKRPDP